MTYITFYQDSDGVVTGFDTSGHAGYAKQGEDIICAAISALVINAVNSIEEFTEDAFKVDVQRKWRYRIQAGGKTFQRSSIVAEFPHSRIAENGRRRRKQTIY